jgi:hypothetical protein
MRQDMALSLTRKQVQSGPGAELLRLLTEGAEAGWVSDDEIRNLHDWLRSNSESAIPAVPFLAKLTDEVFRDGQITGDGRHALRLAAERVLPPDQRDRFKFKRRTLEAEERTRAKGIRFAEKERVREYARLSRPRSFNFMVAGTGHEDRAETIRENVREEQRVFLVREPQNRHDSNAIGVWAGTSGNSPSSAHEATCTLQTYQIGYVPRDVAAEMAPLLDSGYKQLAVCTKILTNSSRGPIPIIDVSLYNAEGNAPREALAVSSGETAREQTREIENTKQFIPEHMEPLVPGWLILLFVVMLAVITVLALER